MTFYIFPTEVAALNVGGVLSTNFNSNSSGSGNVADSVSFDVGVGGIELGSSHLSDISNVPANINNEMGRNINGDVKSNRFPSMQQKQQYYYRHRSSDIITSGAVGIYVPMYNIHKYP